MRGRQWWMGAVGVGLLGGAGALLAGPEYKSGIVWKEPVKVEAGATPGAAPSDAVVLFDGTNLDQWEDGDKWEIADGIATSKKKQIRTKQSFGDCQIHLEWASPAEVKGEGQGRGNSGVYIMGTYEIQILDSWENPTYWDGSAGSLYKQRPPMVNASRKPGEWQTYDILFQAPRFEGKVLTKPGFVTVLHNGVCIHHATELQGRTAYDAKPAYSPHGLKSPLHLQFHGNPVRFRNIWVRDLTQVVGQYPEGGPAPAPATQK